MTTIHDPSLSCVPIGTMPADAPHPPGIKHRRVVLIRPSKYDDQGYVLRFWRGVLPSNTLAVLAGLTHQVDHQRALGAVCIKVEMLDETVQPVMPNRLTRRWNRPGTRTVVALCGVQTNQWHRAADLARQFRTAGLPVMIGGFHVSGAIAMSPGAMPPECQELLDQGVTLVKGEVEDCWADLLRDALHGRLRPFYDISAKPDLHHAALPWMAPRLVARFSDGASATMDTSRGCPFACSFCTVINVQGRTMRCRSPDLIITEVRRSAQRGIDFFFVTDDNFARNPNWEPILDALVGLHEDEGLRFQFMMQVDTQASRIPRFMEKAARAGCVQVFIGMETLNPANLAAAGKRQNHVEQYRQMVEAWHQHGILCHVGYVIGFPHDSPQSVREDLRRLREEIQVDLASFFMLMPLPGSRDHVELKTSGQPMDADFNHYDSTHPTTSHPHMTGDQWSALYEEAWRDFYSPGNMKAILARAPATRYWQLFRLFLWYAHSALVEHVHPMLCGFTRLKSRTQRRPGFPIESRLRYARIRAVETLCWARDAFALYFQMQDVWLATRGRAQWHTNLQSLQRSYASMRHRSHDSVNRAGRALGRHPWTVIAGAQLRASLDRLNLLALRCPSRESLNRFWGQTRRQLRRGRVLRINSLKLAVNLLREGRLSLSFGVSLLLTRRMAPMAD